MRCCISEKQVTRSWYFTFSFLIYTSLTLFNQSILFGQDPTLTYVESYTREIVGHCCSRMLAGRGRPIRSCHPTCRQKANRNIKKNLNY